MKFKRYGHLVITVLMLISYQLHGQVNLTVQVHNIRNNQGIMHVFIFNYENQYPDNPYLHFKVNKAAITKFGTLKCTVPKQLAFGNYGISVLDDENANDDCDRFFGIPTEGFGFSNDVPLFLSFPDYNDILVDLSKQQKTIFITLKYI